MDRQQLLWRIFIGLSIALLLLCVQDAEAGAQKKKKIVIHVPIQKKIEKHVHTIIKHVHHHHKPVVIKEEKIIKEEHHPVNHIEHVSHEHKHHHEAKHDHKHEHKHEHAHNYPEIEGDEEHVHHHHNYEHKETVEAEHEDDSIDY